MTQNPSTGEKPDKIDEKTQSPLPNIWLEVTGSDGRTSADVPFSVEISARSILLIRDPNAESRAESPQDALRRLGAPAALIESLDAVLSLHQKSGTLAPRIDSILIRSVGEPILPQLSRPTNGRQTARKEHAR